MLTDYLKKMTELLTINIKGPSVEIKDYTVLIDGNAFFEFAYKKFRRNL